jgi:predicted ATPase
MYVSHISLRNWRNFTKAEANLSETVYLLGPNASGKSNFLDIFRFMRDIVNPNGGGLQQALASRGGLGKVRSLAARKNPHVELEFELRDSLDDFSTQPDWKYHLSIQAEGSGRQRPLIQREVVYRLGELLLSRPDDDDKSDRERLTQTHLEQINMNREFRDIATFFEDVLYLHLVPQLLKFGEHAFLPNLSSDPFGQGFLEQIAGTPKKTRDSRLSRIQDILEGAIPHFQQLKFVQDEKTGKPHLEMLYKHWRPNAGWQREDQFSDGTLRLIAMLWTLLSSNSMILLEEPELSLHSRVVEQIPKLVYKTRQSRKKAGGQILISTHSEAMLSDTSIDGSFLILKPGSEGEATIIVPPSEDDLMAMRSGMSAADILLPQTASTISTL